MGTTTSAKVRIHLDKGFVAMVVKDEGVKLVSDLEGEIIAESVKGLHFRGHGYVGARIACMCCARDLTNDVSRQWGIGPVCAERLGIERELLEDPAAFEARLRELTAMDRWLPKRFVAVDGERPVVGERQYVQAAPEATAPVVRYERDARGDGWLVLTVPYERKDACKKVSGYVPGQCWHAATKTWRYRATPRTLASLREQFPDLVVDTSVTEAQERAAAARAAAPAVDDALRPDCVECGIVLIRVGDFYEATGNDALLVKRYVSPTYWGTATRKGVEVVGIPYHNVDRAMVELEASTGTASYGAAYESREQWRTQHAAHGGAGSEALECPLPAHQRLGCAQCGHNGGHGSCTVEGCDCNEPVPGCKHCGASRDASPVEEGALGARAMTSGQVLLNAPVSASSPAEPDHPSLRPYQRGALRWAWENETGLLAPDQGTGKTRVALLAREGRTLVLCPKSVVYDWRKEVQEVASGLRLSVVDGERQARLAALAADADLYLMPYSMLPEHAEYEVARDANGKRTRRFKGFLPELRDLRLDSIIFDECHYFRNRKSRLFELCEKLALHNGRPVRRRYGLSGTPVHTNFGDVWPMLKIVDPRAFSSYWRTMEEHCHVDKSGWGGSWVVGHVRDQKHTFEKLQRYVYRVSKKDPEIAAQFPPMTEQSRWVELEPEQRRVYEQMRRTMYATYREAGGNARQVAATEVIAQITRLRQIAVDHHIILADGQEPPKELRGAKAKAVLDIVQGTDSKVIVFSQFTTALKALAGTLEKEGIGHVLYTGELSQKQRDAARERSRDDDGCRVFLCQTRAGGTGLNLPHIDVAVFLDAGFNPQADINQPRDRIHRLNATTPKFCYHLRSLDTVEAGMEDLLAERQDMSDGVIEGRFTERDLSALRTLYEREALAVRRGH